METIYISPDLLFSHEAIAGTVGFFDGVHLGHRFLIDQLKATAGEQQLPSAIITFPIHPRKVLMPEFKLELLNNFEEKLQQLSGTGVDYCYVLDFTRQLSLLTAKEFIQEVLYKQLKVQSLLVGYDHRFGKDRSEGAEDYIRHGQATGIKVLMAEPLLSDGQHVSSTRIRHLLQQGNVVYAEQLLSYPYMLEGIVGKGNRIGRTIGFPTANLQICHPEKAIPATGIYATHVYLNGTKYKGMLYIGSRPSIEGANELRIEVNLLNFDGDIYGQTLQVEFVQLLRGDKKFDSLEQLKKQLETDKAATIDALSKKANTHLRPATSSPYQVNPES